jgi:hypothetical protein
MHLCCPPFYIADTSITNKKEEMLIFACSVVSDVSSVKNLAESFIILPAEETGTRAFS